MCAGTISSTSGRQLWVKRAPARGWHHWVSQHLHAFIFQELACAECHATRAGDLAAWPPLSSLQECATSSLHRVTSS